jgi:enoyl-CoA hydratase/carnithine racemase
MLIPEIFSDIYAYHLGEKRAWEAVQLKQLFDSDEALEVGLVNESVPVEEVLVRSEIYLKSLLIVYPPAFRETKRLMRKNLLKIVDGDLSKKITDVVSNFSDPHNKTIMQEFMNNFKK